MKTANDIIKQELSQSLESARCLNKAFILLEQAMGLDNKQTKQNLNRCRDDIRKDSPL